MSITSFLSLHLFVFLLASCSDAFVPHGRPPLPRTFQVRVSVLTPIGELCPYSTPERKRTGIETEKLCNDLRKHNAHNQKVKLNILSGDADPQGLNAAADQLDMIAKQWDFFETSHRFSDDFQNREKFALTQARSMHIGVSLKTVTDLTKWQRDSLRAMASNRPQPPLPEGFDLQNFLQIAEKLKNNPSLSGTSITGVLDMSQPFDSDKFETNEINEQYTTLILDHIALLKQGRKYGAFDPLGKLAYLDELEKIEDRWDIFFFKNQLMDSIKDEYKRKCEKHLIGMNMDEETFLKLHKKSHELLRKEAEAERSAILQ